jgi:hypothetical protein
LKLTVDARVIAPKGAYANNGDIQGEIVFQMVGSAGRFKENP